ncbi:MAG: TrfA family protein [Geobacteraceae bacterium]|nr:plasmid replication initiator TrfA [Desulfuromonadaceae bacterium]NTV49294.1 TrfA family protein [Geobacteraceae bacterium]NTW78772.1 TrfA family protein [Geobacteraceae bacterium]
MQHNRLQHRASSVDDRSGVDSFERILESLAARPKYLPEWPDTQRAMPNEILRSALFNCRNRNQARLFMKDAEIAVIGDGQVIYRGEELRQDDELVWLHLMHLAKKTHLGDCIDFTPYSFIKMLGWPIKGQSYDRLRVCLSRMQATAIRFQSKRLDTFISVSLILKFRSRNDNNENLSRWEVWVGEEMRLLFDEEFLTRVNWETRRALPDGIASKLFGYWSSHRKPFPVKAETLIKLCGSEMELRHFRIELRKALDVLVKVSFLESWEVKDDLVTVARRH